MKTLVQLLFSEGLEGITETELADISDLVKEALDSVEPEKAEPVAADEEEGEPEPC